MAESKSPKRSAYPLQALPFDTPSAVPNGRPHVTSTSSPFADPVEDTVPASRSSGYSTQAPQGQHAKKTPRFSSHDHQTPASAANGFNRAPSWRLPGSYPLQQAPTRAPPQQNAPNPAPQRAPPTSMPSSGLRPKGSTRRLSLSYPLQARPSQIFRDDTNVSTRTQAAEPNGTALTSKQPSVASKTSTQTRKTSYPLQVMPPPRSPSVATSTTPTEHSMQSQNSAVRSNGTEHAIPGSPPTYPLQTIPMTSPVSPRSNGTTMRSGEAAQEDAKRWRSYGPRSPPTPSPTPSDGTAVSSGVASQGSLRRRHAGDAGNASPGFQQSVKSGGVPTERTGATPTNDRRESNVPRLPRNIRALRNGKTADLHGRTIVICLDGTGDKFDADNSNIVHLVSCLKKSDPSQLTYYQSGIGTYDGGGLSNGMNAALDMAVGSGLGVHIRDAYHFLMQNYNEGDRICIFGFSRGAYTARCLAGMVHKVGLLPRHNVQQLPFAYEHYKDDTEQGWEMSEDFKRTFCVDVSCHFIGCFDSVASVGFIPRTLPLSSTPWNKATHFRHALALDEHRAKFKAKQFETKDSIGPDSQWETVAESKELALEHPYRQTSTLAKPKPHVYETADDGCALEADEYARQRRHAKLSKETDVLEVWFAGAHADVGGGAEKNVVRHKLAQIPLRWMIRQCFECDTGIIFKVHRLAEEGLDVHTLWPTYTPIGVPRMGPSPSLMEKFEKGEIAPISRRSTVLRPVDERDPEGTHELALWKDEEQRHLHEEWVPEHVEDYFDSVSRLNDQLVGATVWWILEMWPIKVRVQMRDSEEWVKKVSVNMGRYRPVQDLRPNLHWTVKQRMDALGYKINARTARGASWNIVA